MSESTQKKKTKKTTKVPQPLSNLPTVMPEEERELNILEEIDNLLNDTADKEDNCGTCLDD